MWLRVRTVGTFRGWIFEDAVSAVGTASVLSLAGGGGCLVGRSAVFAGYFDVDFESAAIHSRILPFLGHPGGITPVAPLLSRRNASA